MNSQTAFDSSLILGKYEYLQFDFTQGEPTCIEDKLLTYGAGAEGEGWPKRAKCAAEKQQQQPKLKQRGKQSKVGRQQNREDKQSKV